MSHKLTLLIDYADNLDVTDVISALKDHFRGRDVEISVEDADAASRSKLEGEWYCIRRLCDAKPFAVNVTHSTSRNCSVNLRADKVSDYIITTTLETRVKLS